MASDLDHVQHPNVVMSEEKVPSPEPLMQEMERLWRHGEQMYDAFLKEDFICRAIIFVTTNDYSMLFALSGQIKHGCSWMHPRR